MKYWFCLIVLLQPNTVIKISIFTESAHWADSVVKFWCLSVCLVSCVFCRAIGCSFFKTSNWPWDHIISSEAFHLSAPSPPNPKTNCGHSKIEQEKEEKNKYKKIDPQHKCFFNHLPEKKAISVHLCLFLYWCYYPYWSSDSVSLVCRIFFYYQTIILIDQLIFYDFQTILNSHDWSRKYQSNVNIGLGKKVATLGLPLLVVQLFVHVWYKVTSHDNGIQLFKKLNCLFVYLADAIEP